MWSYLIYRSTKFNQNQNNLNWVSRQELQLFSWSRNRFDALSETSHEAGHKCPPALSLFVSLSLSLCFRWQTDKCEIKKSRRQLAKSGRLRDTDRDKDRGKDKDESRMRVQAAGHGSQVAASCCKWHCCCCYCCCCCCRKASDSFRPIHPLVLAPPPFPFSTHDKGSFSIMRS